MSPLSFNFLIYNDTSALLLEQRGILDVIHVSREAPLLSKGKDGEPRLVPVTKSEAVGVDRILLQAAASANVLVVKAVSRLGEKNIVVYERAWSFRVGAGNQSVFLKCRDPQIWGIWRAYQERFPLGKVTPCLGTKEIVCKKETLCENCVEIRISVVSFKEFKKMEDTIFPVRRHIAAMLEFPLVETTRGVELPVSVPAVIMVREAVTLDLVSLEGFSSPKVALVGVTSGVKEMKKALLPPPVIKAPTGTAKETSRVCDRESTSPTGCGKKAISDCTSRNTETNWLKMFAIISCVIHTAKVPSGMTCSSPRRSCTSPRTIKA